MKHHSASSIFPFIKTRKRQIPFLLLALIGLSFFLLIHPVSAQSLFAAVEYPELGSQAACVMDAATGTVIFTKNADEEIPPASLTKLMTMHLTFLEINAGRASLDEIIFPTRESWAVNQLPYSSVMNLANGQKVSLNDLLLGLAVFSGNDAAAAVALRFAPTVASFVEMMNNEAAALGLEKTRFVDPAGYWEFNMTTAKEFADFCRIYIEAHPGSLRDYHSVREFAYPRAENVAERFRENPGTRVHINHNTLLARVAGVDGLKTGFIPEAGYNIALTAERNGSRFIAVLLGAPAGWRGDRVRDADGEKLIEWSFANYQTIKLPVQIPDPVRVWKGRENFAELDFGAPIVFTARAERGISLSCVIENEGVLVAPLPAGSRAGTMVIYDSMGELRRIPLLTVKEIERGGFFKRLLDSIRLFFMKKN